jgi:hypothetical protein
VGSGETGHILTNISKLEMIDHGDELSHEHNWSGLDRR